MSVPGAQAREKSEPPNVLGEQYRTTRSGRCFAEDSVKPQPVEPQVPSRKRQKVVHTADGTASQIQQDPATQSRPASARRPHIPEENLRTVRPRPLHIKDKVCTLRSYSLQITLFMPAQSSLSASGLCLVLRKSVLPQVKVFWGTQAEKVQDVDNGAFAQWLQRAEQEQRLGADPTALVGSCQAQVGPTAAVQLHEDHCVLDLTLHTPPGALAQPVARQGHAAADLLNGPLQQVMVVGHEFKAPSQMHNVAKVPSPSKAPAPQPESSRIAIPAYRRLQPSQEPGMSVSTQG